MDNLPGTTMGSIVLQKSAHAVYLSQTLTGHLISKSKKKLIRNSVNMSFVIITGLLIQNHMKENNNYCILRKFDLIKIYPILINFKLN